MRASRTGAESLEDLGRQIEGCRICREAPAGRPLPHEPKPILRVSETARIAVCGQAPGIRAHEAGMPFADPSGVRLRSWMGVDEATFYDASRIAIVPMGFCFPGYNAAGSDLPPRKECRATWHDALFAALPRLDLLLLIGSYALAYHLPERRGEPMTGVVRDWRAIFAAPGNRKRIALPHPSWRNNGWLKQNPWFEAELVPVLRREVQARL